MHCRNSYQMPLRKRHVTKISKRKSGMHRGTLRYSIDFLCPEGTPVYASLGGLVVFVKADSKVGGPSRDYNDHGNRIVIRHKYREYTAYEHLRYRGAKVKKGDRVRKGQLIGWSGNTGNSTAPHLHFEVFHEPNEDESEGTTLRVLFKNIR